MMRFRHDRAVSAVNPLDPDAEQWAGRVIINGGAAPAAATVLALSTFCAGMKAAGVWAKIIALNFFAPDSLTAALTPLVVGPGNDPWTNFNFVAGDLTVNGLLGNGVNKYLDIGITPSVSLNIADCGLSLYGFTLVAGRQAMGVIAGGGAMRLLPQDAANNPFYSLAGTRSFANAMVAGYYSCNRLVNTGTYYLANSITPHALIDTVALGGVLPNRSIYAFCINSGGVAANFTTARISMCAVNNNLTAAESLSFYTLFQAFRTTLGGGFV